MRIRFKIRRFLTPRRKGGFTLVEVMLAIAVVSIGIIAILGLLPTGLQSSRDAADNTLAANIVQYTFGQLRAYPFNAAQACANCPPHDLTLGTAPPPDNAYYDYAGAEVIPGAADRYYHVRISYILEPTPTLWSITAEVTWPALSAAPINKHVFATQVAQYDL